MSQSTDQPQFWGKGGDGPSGPTSEDCGYTIKIFAAEHKGVTGQNYEGPYRYVSDGSDFLGPFARPQASNEWEVTSIASGDLDNTGEANLITAFHAYNGFNNTTRIWFASDDGASETMIWSGSSDWTIPDMTTGDFDGDDVDELAVVFVNTGGDYPIARIWIYEYSTGLWNQIYYDTEGEWDITAISGGNVIGNSHEDLVVAFDNNFTNKPRLHFYDFANDSWHLQYDGTSEWTIGSLACGHFEYPDTYQEVAVAFNNDVGGGPNLYMYGNDLPTPWWPFRLTNSSDLEGYKILGLATEDIDCEVSAGGLHSRSTLYSLYKYTDKDTPAPNNNQCYILKSIGLSPGNNFVHTFGPSPWYVNDIAASNHQ